MQKTLRTPVSFTHICKTSLLTATGMVSFFFLMKLFYLNTVLELRYLNFVFIFFAVRHILLHQESIAGAKIMFHAAMMLGFVTVFFTSFLFSIFVFVYLNLDTTFMTMVGYSQPFGSYLSPASCAFVTFLEGIASGSVVAIPVLRTMKRRERALESATQNEQVQLLN